MTDEISIFFQGDYIWIEPVSGKEFDVAIGARVVSAEGRRIQVKDDDNKVCRRTFFLFIFSNLLKILFTITKRQTFHLTLFLELTNFKNNV